MKRKSRIVFLDADEMTVPLDAVLSCAALHVHRQAQTGVCGGHVCLTKRALPWLWLAALPSMGKRRDICHRQSGNNLTERQRERDREKERERALHSHFTHTHSVCRFFSCSPLSLPLFLTLHLPCYHFFSLFTHTQTHPTAPAHSFTLRQTQGTHTHTHTHTH